MTDSKNYFKGLALVLVLTLTASCAFLGSFFAEEQITTIDNVSKEGQQHAIPADLNLLPKDIRDKLEKEGKTVVIVNKNYVLDPEKAVTVTKPEVESIITVVLDLAKTFWPGIAVLEGLGALFSRRKRQHYVSALRQATPLNGRVELKDAFISLGRAIGVAHSSENTKGVFEEEVKAAKVA